MSANGNYITLLSGGGSIYIGQYQPGFWTLDSNNNIYNNTGTSTNIYGNLGVTGTSTLNQTSFLQPLTLCTSYIAPISGQLGYNYSGTVLTGTTSFISGTTYNLASMTLPVGTWNVFGVSCFNVVTGGSLTSDSHSISKISAINDNSNIIINGSSTLISGQNIVRRLNTIITSSGSQTVYLTITLSISTGTYESNTTSQSYVNFYAIRIA
jgi:hypothetical protein